MYAASEQFHKAVYERNPSERVLIRMPNLCFNAEDIINSNLTFTEAVNNSEELTIGECVASTLDFKVLNDHGLLSDYPFTGDCEAYIGVCTEETENPDAPEMPYAIFRYGMEQPVLMQGHMTEPYFTINGAAPTMQPPFPVHAIVIDGNTVYCLSEDGDVWGAVWMDGHTWDYMAQFTWDEAAQDVWDSVQGYLVPLVLGIDWNTLRSWTWDGLRDNFIGTRTTEWDDLTKEMEIIPFMKNKFKKWAFYKRGIWHNDNVSYEFGDKVERYEYIPLGKFLPDQPKKRRVSRIDFTAKDRMALFDRDATEFLDALTYPTTIGDVLYKLCSYVEVGLATQSFINSTRRLEEALFDGEEVTCREILGWIAEAACSYARMTRDGELELVWFGTEAINIPMTQYFNIDVAEYTVSPIDKLRIMGSETDVGVIIGDGTNGYQIVDNPYLYGENDAEVRALGVPIYTRLAAYPAFTPINARAVCDWSIQAGDIISITLEETTYTLPIYRQTITWNGGGCRVTYESTGSPARPVMTATNRRVFNQKRAIHELVVSVDGIDSRIENAEGDITTLKLFADGLTLDVANGDESSTIRLMSGSAEISSKDIRFNGMVTFSGLANGTTTIDGDCIKTGTVAASRIDVNNLYVKHLSGADGTFTGTLSAANGTFTGTLQAVQGTFTSLDAAGGAVHIGTDYIDVNGIEFGYVPGYSDICLVPPSHQRGNIGFGALAWSQCVAQYLYSANGGVSSYSDRRLKDNIRPYDDDVIDKLTPVRFVMKADAGRRDQIGFIANDVATVIPEVVQEFQDGSMSEPVLTLDYGRLVVPLVSALQKMQRRIADLESRVEILEKGGD